jgi:putative oxidoreductase
MWAQEEVMVEMRTLALSPMDRLAGFAPLVVRVIVGIIMAAHGFQKLVAGPGAFGQMLGQMNIPLSGLMAYVVVFVELLGGLLLIVGLFSRLAALLLTINLTVAILLVKVNVGFLSPPSGASARNSTWRSSRGSWLYCSLDPAGCR